MSDREERAASDRIQVDGRSGAAGSRKEESCSFGLSRPRFAMRATGTDFARSFSLTLLTPLSTRDEGVTSC